MFYKIKESQVIYEYSLELSFEKLTKIENKAFKFVMDILFTGYKNKRRKPITHIKHPPPYMV
jgi:hypothetical protein